MENKVRSRLSSHLFNFLALASVFCWFLVVSKLAALQGYSIASDGDSPREIRCSEEHELERRHHQVKASSSKSCFRYNSEAWLNGTRLSNADNDMTKDYVQDIIEYAAHPLQIDTMKKITSQTLCHAKSNFTNPSESRWSPDMANEVYFRLIYMSIYHMFHAPALDEMRARKDCKEDLSHQIRDFDYECPNAKFFVAPYTKDTGGAGSSIRNGIVSTMLDAIAVGRIPIFLNNVQSDDIDPTLKKPSMLASCDRGDLQCMFKPVSPCTVTLEEIRGQQTKHFAPSDLIDAMADPVTRNERVWVVTGRKSFSFVEKNHALAPWTRKNLHATAMKLIEEMMAAPDAALAPPDKWKALHQAASRLLKQYDHPLSSTYFNDEQPLVHAGLMYFMRPKPSVKQIIDDTIDTLIPDHMVGRESDLMGVMIRGSDKCMFEATCLTKETYQDMIAHLRKETGINDIILTSEDRKMLDEVILNSSTHITGSANYIYNKEDVSPGTGNARDWQRKNIASDDIMLSALIVLKLQLHSSLIIGNCCSNFHNVLFDLYREGCGMVENGKFKCMQALENPKFHSCCASSTTNACKDQGRDLRNRVRRAQGMPPEPGTSSEKESPKKAALKKGNQPPPGSVLKNRLSAHNGTLSKSNSSP